MLKGPTGKVSAFIVTAAGDPGLDRFVHQPAASQMTVAAAARNAELRVDGILVTRPANSIADLLPGVRLDLVRAVPGTVVEIAASRDAAGLGRAIADLADAVNALTSLTATLTRGGSDGAAAGALAGDGTLRTLQRQLGNLTITGGLAALGVTTLRSGQMSVDATKLSAALALDSDAVETLLAGLTAPGGALVAARSVLGTGTGSKYVREQRAVAGDRAALDIRSSTLRSQLTRQYAAMERAVGGFKATGSFLDQQIKAWNRTTN